MRAALAAALATAAIACAHGRAPPGLASGSEQAPPAPAATPQPPRCRVERGMDATGVTRCLGQPDAIERRASPTAPGTVYERWVYRQPPAAAGDLRLEVWMIDGRVADVTGVREQP